MRKYIDGFSRFFVGGLFIFSGLIKLNDPVGTEIKLEEYFEVFATDFGSFFQVFIPYALHIGLVLVVLEIVLGVAVLINYRMQLTTTVLLLLIIFFTFLTGYSAILNKVTDCGCFGDAIKLTPWQSFYKDLILIVFILHLFWYRKSYEPVLRTREGHAVILGVTAISFLLGIYAIRHLPFIDFRAYKIGNNIPEQMKLPPNAKRDSVVMTFIYEHAGTRKELTMDQLGQVDSTYTFVDRIDKVVREGDRPKIIDYRVESTDGENFTQQTFEGAKLLIVTYNVKDASVKNASTISKLINELEGKVEAIILTSSSAVDVEAFRHEHQWAAPYFFADATVLKTIVRSNPGLTLWVNGTVKGMWHHNDTPTASEVLELIK
ncbi:MAG: DoxX family protein [Cyclobacteriaceae bacterium]|nr:DoxX family protein [Cyclobacteriaceae bacterium]UYN86444.1 MAG: DoxX family protein [Cyclobacteriaceae bacterium]